MMHHSAQPRDQIFVKDYGFLSFARNMERNVGEIISQKLNSKYSQKLLHHAKQSGTAALKTVSKRVIQKTAEATTDLIGNKIADKITLVSKTSPENNSVINEKEILKERYISPEERQKIIDDLRLI